MKDYTKSIIDSTPKEDRVSKLKTLYSASPFEIISRNLLAGASRALGGIILYILFFFFVSVIFYRFIIPKFMPVINKFFDIGDSLDKLQQMQTPPKFSFPENSQ